MAFRAGITIKGTEQLIQAMRRVSSTEHRRAQKAMDEGAKFIVDYSNEIVPLDTGALRDSSFNQETANTPKRIEQTIGYGSPAADVNPKSGIHPGEYAVTQHQDAWKHQNGRERFYLRKAMFRKAREWVELLRRRLKI